MTDQYYPVIFASENETKMRESFAPSVLGFFNTAGLVKPDIHYCLDMLKRFNPEGMESMIYQQKCFILRVPPSGSTYASGDDATIVGERVIE